MGRSTKRHFDQLDASDMGTRWNAPAMMISGAARDDDCLLAHSVEPRRGGIGTSKTSYVKNVFPRADGYGPVQSLCVHRPLTSRCMGVFGGVDENGGSVVFAGTLTGFIALMRPRRVGENVSKLGGYSRTKGDMWSFVHSIRLARCRGH